jgi:hypothetical protein
MSGGGGGYFDIRDAQFPQTVAGAKRQRPSEEVGGKISEGTAFLQFSNILRECSQWRFYVGAGGAQAPPNVGQAPPQIFGQLNFFLETGNQEIIELSILSHIACYLT